VELYRQLLRQRFYAYGDDVTQRSTGIKTGAFDQVDE